MLHTSPTELSDENIDDFLNNDSPRYSDDHIQNVRLQATKPVNGFTPISMNASQPNAMKKKPINQGFMAIPMDDPPQPKKMTPLPKPKSSGSRLLRKNTIDKAIDTASMITADSSLIGGPSVIQKVPAKEKQQFHPMYELDDGISQIDDFQGNVPPVSEIPSTLNPFSIPPIPKKFPLSQSSSSNHSTISTNQQPQSGAESFQLFTQLPPIPLPPSNQNPLSAMKKSPKDQNTDLQQMQASNKVQFAPVAHPQDRFNQQQFNQEEEYQQQQNNSIALNNKYTNDAIQEEENVNNQYIQQVQSNPIENYQQQMQPQIVHNVSPRFQERNEVADNEFQRNFQQNNYTNPQNQEMQLNQNSQQYLEPPISNQQIQKQADLNAQNQDKSFDHQFQQKPPSNTLYENMQNPSQSSIYQHPNAPTTQMQPPNASPHLYQPLFYGPLGSLEMNFVSTLNRTSSTLKRLFTSEFTNLMKQQYQTSTSFESLDIDEYSNSIISEISQIIETPIQNIEINQTGIARRISTIIDEETKLMTIGLREADAKNSSALESQVNELKKLQIELDTLKNSVKTNTDEILREFEKERSDTISMNEFSQSFVNELERRSRSIQIKQVELNSKATHQNVEKESIERMMKQLNQKKQNFNPFDPIVPERGATYSELISSEMNKIRQIIRESVVDEDDEFDIQNKSLSQSVISPAVSIINDSIRILQNEIENQKKEFMNLQLSNRIVYAAQSQPQSRISSSLNQTSFQPNNLNSDLIRRTRGNSLFV